MTSDKRPILSGKRSRSRRKRAALRAAKATASPMPEPDSDEDKHLATSSDKTTSQSENEDELEDELVFVCRPTMPDFCSVFLPQNEEPVLRASDCKAFTVHVPTFQETSDGFVTYTLELTTCDEPCHTFQLERRFSEFVACAAQVNKQFANGFAARCCAEQEGEESKDTASENDRDFQWELPAKTWCRVTQTSVLEKRRTQLERSLETLLLQQDRRICNLPVLRDFLMLDIFGVQVAEQKNLETTVHFE